MINEETLKGKWNEIKGEIRTKWGNLTEDELEKSKGNMTSIAGLIQQRYGESKERVEEVLQKVLARFSEKTEKLKNEMRDDDQSMRQ